MIKKNKPEISIILPAYNEEDNISILIKRLHKVLSSLTKNYEIIVIDDHSKDSTVKEAKAAGAKIFLQKENGYGAALKEGFQIARGDYIVTMDANLSHDPLLIKEMWAKRHSYDLIIASSGIKGGKAEMPIMRKTLSRFLNLFFSYTLSTPIKDLSSSYRMYKKEVLDEIIIVGKDFNVLQEILVRAYSAGFMITEIPIHYKPRNAGKTKAHLFKFFISYLKTLKSLWTLRNSIESADYDERAYYSKIPLQRYWQRKRYKIVMNFLSKEDKSGKNRVLDIGCGSSKIIQNLPEAIGLDKDFKKLRYLRKTNKHLINASINDLPFKDKSFDTVICSQVIEHIKMDKRTFGEMNRVLKNKGKLIIGTPDYSTISWRFWEWIYGKVLSKAYADEHITHYTKKSLDNKLIEFGFNPIKTKYVCGAEMITFAIKSKDV